MFLFCVNQHLAVEIMIEQYETILHHIQINSTDSINNIEIL